MIIKDWQKNKRELTEDECLLLEEIKEQGAGDTDDALNYAAVSLRMARKEQDRLRNVIEDLRGQVQRLEFPDLYPPNIPEGAESIAERIYAAAAHAVKLMQREGMQENYEVTFNSLSEIASYGRPLCVVSDE